MMRNVLAVFVFFILARQGIGSDKVAIFTYSFNRPDFIKIQKKTLDKFLLDEYEFIVFNDANEKRFYQEIRQTCNDLQIRCIDMPQKLHTSKNASGRNADIVNYSLKVLGFDYPGIVLLLDSDMFLVKEFSVKQYMKDYAISGLSQSRSNNSKCIDYLWIGLVFLDMPNLPGRKYIDFGLGNVRGVQTDTGGKTHYYLSRHRDMRVGSIDMKYARDAYQFLQEGGDLSPYSDFDEDQIDFIRDSYGGDSEFYLGSHFFHYRGGTNWDNQSSSYHEQKTRAFNHYIDSILDEN